MPKVSVLIPTFNAGEWLQPSIDSILAQTHKDLEIILVDDGSTDGSVDRLRHKVRDHRLLIVRQANAGKPAALNCALRMASGEFVVLQDADDVSDPRRIELQTAALMSTPSAGAALCGYELIMDERRLAPVFQAKDAEACHEAIARFAMPGHDPTIMIRKDIAVELLFDEELPVVEGYDFVLRVGERFPMVVVGEVLYGYRIHKDSITRSGVGRRILQLNRALRKACLRRGLNPDLYFPPPDVAALERKPHVQDNGLAAIFVESVRNLNSSGRRGLAIANGVACAKLQPLNWRYYKPLIYSILPVCAHDFARSVRAKGTATAMRSRSALTVKNAL